MDIRVKIDPGDRYAELMAKSEGGKKGAKSKRKKRKPARKTRADPKRSGNG